MTTRAQELEVRNILQGLEEFASFMSYQSNYEGLRIISVESNTETNESLPSAQVLPFKAAKCNADDDTPTMARAITR
jgi:hypothetical protein